MPRVIENLSGRRVLTMEWIEGVKLADGALVGAADLPLLRVGIACTLSQCLESGFMHADPHGGNLLKTSSSPPRLAYLDFGLVSEVPVEVRFWDLNHAATFRPLSGQRGAHGWSGSGIGFKML